MPDTPCLCALREGLAAARYWLVGFVQGDYGVNLVERYREKRDAL